MTSLSGKQRRTLRALAHHLDPVVLVGKEGVTSAVSEAVDQALTDHELIKVRVLEACPEDRETVAARLEDATEAAVPGQVGRIVLLYRRHPTKPRIGI